MEKEEKKVIYVEETIDKSVTLDETESETEPVVYIRPKTRRCWVTVKIQQFFRWLFPTPKYLEQ